VKGIGDRGVLLALGVTIVIWASAFAAIRAGLEGYSPGHLALLRFRSLRPCSPRRSSRNGWDC
jgi:hypothetical protein